MTNNTIKNNILDLRDAKAIIDSNMYEELDTIDEQLDNKEITQDQYDILENDIYIRYSNIDNINSELLSLEKLYINNCIAELKAKEQYSNELKELFKQAQTNVTIHDKILNKLL